MPTAAILAGGRARRLGGRDKSQLVIGGRTILDRQIDALRQVVDRVVIVTSDPSRILTSRAPVVQDLVPDAGGLGGILTALSTGTDRVLVVACDMPFVTAPFLAHVLEAGQQADAAVPRDTGGYHPLCACYSQACAGPIRQRVQAGALKVVDLFGDIRVRDIGPDEIAAYDPDGLLLLNINTPDDLARAERGRDQSA